MNRLKSLLLGMAASAAVLPGIASSAPAPLKAQATFINAAGNEIGAAQLMETPRGVLIEFSVNKIPSGEHGFHIHETGSCELPEFQSAGGHFNPGGQAHGYYTEDGHHAGDMPNQFVRNDGLMRGHVFNPAVTLRAGEASLFDADGSALVIHSGADDYSSQPSGAAGKRIACAVIEKM